MAGNRGRRSSRRGRGGARGKGEKAPQQIHRSSTDDTIDQQNPIDQVYPVSPPFSLRYPTRHARAVLGQFGNLTSPLRSPLRSIKRSPSHSSSLNQKSGSLNEPGSSDIVMLESHHFMSQPTGEDLVCKNAVEDVKTSVSTGSPSWSGPITKHMQDQDNLGPELTSQFQGPQEVQQVASQSASHQDLPEKYQPSRENDVVLHVEDRLEKSTKNFVPRNSRCLSTSHSINVTEFAQRLQDDLEDDPEEVESAPGPAFDCVNGHRVKIEIAPLLRAIFEKYGDITCGSDIRSSNILSFFLERLCDIYKRLEQTTFFDVTCIELNEMLDEVGDFEREKLNVRWLLEKLECISESKIKFQEYLNVKKEDAEYDKSLRSIDKDLEVYEKELSLIQQKISAAKEERVVMKAKSDYIKKVALDIKTRVNTLGKQSLVHGLL